MDKRTYTVEEVAQMLNIARGKVYEHVSRGEIPGVIRLGHRILISKTVFDEWLAGNVVQASA